MFFARFQLVTVGLAVALFLAMLLFLELGRRSSLRHVAKHGTGVRAGVGVVDGTIYGLLGLLIGFTFSGAATRFDHRRELIAQEVNEIGTAWERIDLLPAEAQPAIRSGFRRFLDALLEEYAKPPNSADVLRESAALTRAQNDVWARAVAASLAPSGESARLLLLPAMNEMFSIVESERLARRMHPPIAIFVMLGLTALAAALFGGYGLASGPTRNWIYIVGVAATISVAAYVILDLEYPRLGLIRVDTADLVELRATMR
jgi:hypothetical protein